MKNFRKMMPVAVAAAMILSGCGSNPAELFNDVKLVQSTSLKTISILLPPRNSAQILTPWSTTAAYTYT